MRGSCNVSFSRTSAGRCNEDRWYRNISWSMNPWLPGTSRHRPQPGFSRLLELFLVLAGGCAIQEIEVIDQRQRFDSEDGGNVLVADRQQIVAVILLTPRRKIGRTAKHHLIRSVKPAHDELGMNLVLDAADVRDLIERRRQLRLDRLP